MMAALSAMTDGVRAALGAVVAWAALVETWMASRENEPL